MVTVRPGSEQLPLTVTFPGAAICAEAAGLEMVTVGGVLSIVTAGLGPADRLLLPARSVTTPATTEIVTVPSPVHPESVTVRLVSPVPLTAAPLHAAVPVFERETSVSVIETAATPLPPVSVKLSVTAEVEPLRIVPTLGEPKESTGRVWSRITLIERGAEVLPAASAWLTEMVLVPSPALKVTSAVYAELVQEVVCRPPETSPVNETDRPDSHPPVKTNPV
jgi:hypothetical protein